MSIFSFIKTSANVIKTAVTSPIKSLSAGVQAVTVAVANPLTLATQGYTKAYEKTASSKLSTNITKIVLNTGTVATATLGAGTIAGRTIATKVLTSAVKNPITTLSTAILTPIGYGVITQNPVGLGQSVVKTANNLSTFGADFADFQAYPSTDGALNLVKKHPTAIITSVIASGLLTGSALTLLKGAYDAYKYNKVTDAIQDIKLPDGKKDAIVIEDKRPSDTSSQPIINIYNPPQPIPQTAPIITPAVTSSPAVVQNNPTTIKKKAVKKKAKKKPKKKKAVKKKAKKKPKKKKKSIKRKKTIKNKVKNGK
jgi:hypothetical protein